MENTSNASQNLRDNEQHLSSAFKAAAQSVTLLYKESLCQNKRSYTQGYMACANDVLHLFTMNSIDVDREDAHFPVKSLVEFLKRRQAALLDELELGRQGHPDHQQQGPPASNHQEDQAMNQPGQQQQVYHHQQHMGSQGHVPTLTSALPPTASQSGSLLPLNNTHSQTHQENNQMVPKLECDFSFRPPQTHRQIPHTLPTRHDSVFGGAFASVSSDSEPSQLVSADSLKRRASAFDYLYPQHPQQPQQQPSGSSNHNVQFQSSVSHVFANSGFSPPFKRGKVMPMQEDQ
jgi:hypothetical protein